MPDPVLPGLQQKNPDPLGGLTKKKVRRWLGLSDGKLAKLEGVIPKKLAPTPPPKVATEIPGIAPPVLDALGPVPPIFNRALPQFSIQGPATFSNVYNDDRNIFNQMIGASVPSVYEGVDWGINEGNQLNTGVFSNGPLPDRLQSLGAFATKEERTLNATGAITVKTYTVAETLYHPWLIAQLENIMTGGTAGNETWGKWSTQVTNINIQAANYTWSNWASNTATASSTGTITTQATANATAGTYIIDSNMLQGNWAGWAKKTHETEEQKKKRIDDAKVQEQMWLQRQREEEAKKARVKVRAEKILVRNLTAAQALTLKDKGYFDVDVGEKAYRIWRGTHGNIKELNKEGKEVASLCVQPNGVPIEDAMLAQLLWLRADEKALLRVANRTVLRT